MATKSAPSVGDPIPAGDQHGISVQLPLWEHTVGWSNRDPEVLNRMQTGYPRFFIPHLVEQLADVLVALFHERLAAHRNLSPKPAQRIKHGVVLQTSNFAQQCREFLTKKGVPFDEIDVFSYNEEGVRGLTSFETAVGAAPGEHLHVVSYPAEHFSVAKSFWQHTGFGISSRCAEYWLRRISLGDSDAIPKSIPEKSQNKVALGSKSEIQKRLADMASTDISNADTDDVFLYPTGMSAISHTAAAIAGVKGNMNCRVAVFGFLYVDTFKVLTTVYGFDNLLYGYASNAELDVLETDLAKGNRIDALYTEFPGNPLLQSPDLERIYAMSRKYHFLVIVDDTVGTSINLALLDRCDIICTSLSKMFSGECNVMGGSLVLNPMSPYITPIKQQLESQFVDAYFHSDAIVMEHNSRDFRDRVFKACDNTEAICQLLQRHHTVTHLFYPRGSETHRSYDAVRRPGGGYGFLFSLTFKTAACAIAFHDSLNVAKGPSLGTNFTLACAYTLLAHAKELEWAAKHGVVEHLVRVSVGLEEKGYLMDIFSVALDAAKKAFEREHSGSGTNVKN